MGMHYLHNPQQANQTLRKVWETIKGDMLTGRKFVLSIKPETRSTAQNARLWAMLTDVSKQVEWYGKKLSPEDWKHVTSASLRKLGVVPNLEGTGFVALGLSTSRMSVREMSDLIDLIDAFGSQHGVKWSDPSLPDYTE